MDEYPWYATVDGNEGLMQGDFVISCPIVVPPPHMGLGTISTEAIEYDVIVMSQSCDIVQGKLELVLVCPVWPLAKLEEKSDVFKSSKGKEALRRGNTPGYHLLNKCELDGFKTEAFLVVDFRSVFSVPFQPLVELIAERGKRLRLLPPYREHLAQAFARFFMRVGLPIDIPSFT